LKAIGLAAITALVCVGCTDSGVDTNGREVDVFLDRVDGTTYPLTVTINPYGGGTVSRNPNNYGNTYTPGEQVKVTAAAAYNYAFINWSGASTATTPTIDIKMDNPKSLTANFKRTYTLTANPSPYDGGSVSRNPSNSAYLEGTSVSVTATARPEYVFTGWSGASTSTSSTITVTMNEDKTLIANFKRYYSVTVNANPSHGGSVSRNPTNSPNMSNSVYLEGTQVNLTATAASSYTFTGWSDGSTANPRTITINSAITLTANFLPVYTLTTDVTPYGGGSVSRNPNLSGYTSGERVTLTASAASSCYRFTGWTDASTGALVSTSTQYTITMDSNKRLTANFDLITYTLSVNSSPSYGGSVSRYPNKTTYTCGEQVTVTAEPATNSGYVFTNWSGASTSTNTSVTITMDGNKTLTANFQQRYVVTFNANGATSGTAPNAQTANAGENIQLPYQGSSMSRTCYSFGGWIDGGTGVIYPAGSYYSPNGNVTMRAKWDMITYTITFNANSGNGTPPQVQTIDCGESITLPDHGNLYRTGYRFAGWSTNNLGTGTIYQPGTSYPPAGSTSITGNTYMYAIWIRVYTVTFNANGGSGTPPPAQTVDAGKSITLPNQGNLTNGTSTFVGWSTSNSGGTLLHVGSFYEPTSNDSNVIIYARWE